MPEVIHEVPEVREVHHVTTDSGSGTGAGMVLGIVLVLLVLAVAAFVFFGNGFRGVSSPAQPNSGQTNIQVNPPANPPKIEVNPPAAPAQPAQPAQPGGSQPAPSKP